VYIEDVLLGNSEYSVRVDELITALLHCDKSNLLSEILKHDKMGGAICIRAPTPNFGGFVPCTCVIYAHGLIAYLFLCSLS